MTTTETTSRTLTLDEIRSATPEAKWADMRRNQYPVYVLYAALGLRLCLPLSRLGISPVQVTTAGLLLCILMPCIPFLTLWLAPENTLTVACLLLAAIMGLFEILDIADGTLARATKRTSDFGGWLDAVGDQAYKVSGYLSLGLIVQAFAPESLGGMGAFGAAFGLGAGCAMIFARLARELWERTSPQKVYPFDETESEAGSVTLFQRVAQLEYLVPVALAITAFAGGVPILLAVWVVYGFGDFALTFITIAARR